jgi:hypothetical protein
MKAEKPGKAAAVVHVNRTYQPTPKEFETAAAMFAKDQSKWSRQLGPEPGHAGLQVPAEILSRHGIDAQTGLPVREKAPGIREVAS